MVIEETDDAFLIEDDTYTVQKLKPVYLLKKIKIKKEDLKYSFIGGMWYTTDTFSLKQDISLPFPFSTYYTFKIPDIEHGSVLYRSSLYVKTPVFVIQYKETCTGIIFDPVIECKGSEIFPFISLEEDEKFYSISFSIFSSYDIKTKKYAWLGRGKKDTVSIPFEKKDTFRFKTKLVHKKSWQEIIQTYLEETIPTQTSINTPERVFKEGKKALWRSYDHLTGSFLQLPWRDQCGFTFQNSSYSLLSYEAVRLDYFNQWSQTIKDQDLLQWKVQLKDHFINPSLSTTPKEKGEGLIWYNMTNLTKNGLTGYFYMDCGYSGYPGGQSSIVYHLLSYIKNNPDVKLKKRIQETIKYILSTQKDDGSWPMAIRHEGTIRFRPEKLERFTTSGGTGESIRALLIASKLYSKKEYESAALHGLEYLKNTYPICFHGLRDIGIREPEAFSAVSIAHAFLDGYDHTNNNEYLEYAINYAMYLAPWIYTYDSRQWHLSYTIHPISYSITPRVSPYETVWVVSLFLRLATYSKNDIWERIARVCYLSVLPFVSETGGLSEGVFPIYDSSLQPIPMEQTFATVELMHASYQFMTNDRKSKIKKRSIQNNKDFEFKRENAVLDISYKGEVLCSIDAKKATIAYLKNVDLGTRGISLSFNGPYKLTKRIKQKIKSSLRGSTGKYILGIKDATYALTGVKPPKKQYTNKIDFFSDHIKSYSIEIISSNKASVKAASKYHEMQLTIETSLDNGKPVITIDPLIISILDHDLEYTSVYVPLIDAEVTKKGKDTIKIKGCTIKGDFPVFQEKEGMLAVDQILATNWTHGGIFTTKLHIIFDK